MKKVINLFGRNKALIMLALPIFLELFFQFLIGFIDSLQMSFDQIAVAAINQTNTLVSVVTIVFSVLSTASIILVTQLKGLGDEDSVKKIYNISFYFNLLLGVIVSLFLFFGAEFILRLMGVEELYFNEASIYLRLTGGFSFLTSLSTILAAFLRSNKLMIQSTIVTAALNVFNIAGNALALFVFKAGITGVAISSTISRSIGLIIIFVMYFHYIKVSLNPKNLFPFPKSLFLKLLKVGLPSAGEALSYNLSQFVILIIINNFFLFSQGIDVNIRGYVISFTTLVYMFSNGVSQAMQVMLGPRIANHQFEEADHLVKDTVKMSYLVTLVMSLLFLAIGYPLLFALLKIDDPVLKQQSMIGVLIILGLDVLLELGRSGNIPYVRALQTAGDIYFPVSLAIVICWVVAVLGTLLFSAALGLGVIGCWIACALDENIRNIIFFYRWRGGKWKKMSLFKSETKVDLSPSSMKQEKRKKFTKPH